jgi:hypothetical protein
LTNDNKKTPSFHTSVLKLVCGKLHHFKDMIDDEAFELSAIRHIRDGSNFNAYFVFLKSKIKVSNMSV